MVAGDARLAMDAELTRVHEPGMGGVDKRTVLLDGSVNITFTQGIRTRSAPVDEPMETPSKELATWSKIPAQNPNALF